MNRRLLSLDVLRGFDMFFIMGGEALICSIAALCGCPDFGKSFDHVRWEGLQFMDTVFPLFLFMAGASFPFSCAKSRARGMGDGRIALRCLQRGLTLFALGLVYSGLLKFQFANLRFWSVLGRIGIAWMGAAWIYLGVKSWKVRLAVAVAVLAGVTLFTNLVPAPDALAGESPFSPHGNFGCWLDRTLLGAHNYEYTVKTHDPEGFAGLLPAVVTALLGMFAGDIVRAGSDAATGRKALRLVGCAALCAAAGFALVPVCPIVKQLWTPSFVLVVGAYSFAMFALFYWLIDVRGLTRGTLFFKVIGMNSITIYLGQPLLHLGSVANTFFCGVVSLFPAGAWQGLASRVAYVAVCWLFLYFLYRKNVFLKV